MKQSVKTCCPYCGVGCGVVANIAGLKPDAAESISIQGDETHPANFGKLCSKGSDLAATLTPQNRLLYPLINGSRSSWDAALDLVSDKLQRTIDEYGAESVAFYVSGQLLTEDYYVVNKLVKGYLGTANIDTNSRLCMASSVAGHKRAFGSDTVPGCYDDIEQADLVVLTGSNLAWCHPILFQRLQEAKKRRPALKVVGIDPRITATCDLADLHLQIKSGSDISLFSGLLSYLAEHELLDNAYIQNHTSGFEDCLELASKATSRQVSADTGIQESQLAEFYRLFAGTRKVVTIYSQGVNQSEQGTDTVNSIINCHLATGRIGRPGMGPFSVTGQPNAMGGREVGGLSNMLAAHMELAEPSHRQLVQEFWRSPKIADKPGLKAVDLFQAIADKQIRFLWIMATNPVDSMPRADSVKAALSSCDFVVVSDIVENNDTQMSADVRLPAAAWSEKDGTVTNSERCISRQRAFRKPLGEARPDWWQVVQVARRLGYADAFDYEKPSAIFREHAALSAYRNNGRRDFDIGYYEGVSDKEYDALQSFYWPASKTSEPAEKITVAGGVAATESVTTMAASTAITPVRFFSDGNFFTGNARARFVAVDAKPIQRNKKGFPLILNTGRIRDQWHTMTRTGYSSRLNSHLAEPFVQIHPDDASRYGIKAAELVQVSSEHADVVVRALVTEKQLPGNVFVPIHWSEQFASNARVDKLVSSITDPFSGQPASKSEPVSLSKVEPSVYGFAVSRVPIHSNHELMYWAVAPCSDGWRTEFASASGLEQEVAYWKALPSDVYGQVEVAEFADEKKGMFSLAAFSKDELQWAVFLARTPVSVSRVWASQQLQVSHSPTTRSVLLAGIASAERPDQGAIVCSCFMVGSNDIRLAIQKRNCLSVEAIGEHTSAGTNCGSCRSEIRGLLKQTQTREMVCSPS